MSATLHLFCPESITGNENAATITAETIDGLISPAPFLAPAGTRGSRCKEKKSNGQHTISTFVAQQVICLTGEAYDRGKIDGGTPLRQAGSEGLLKGIERTS